MHRAVAALVIVVIAGAQPTYVCVLICLLQGHAGHGNVQALALHAPADAGPGGARGMHHHSPASNTDGGSEASPTAAPCHTGYFTSGTMASIAPISVTVVAVRVTLPDVAAPRSRRALPDQQHLPDFAFPEIESPPPRV